MIGELGTYDYILLGVLAFALLFSFFIGLNKMIRLIIGNYILIAISLAIRNLIYIAIGLLEKFIEEPDQIQTMLQNSRSTISFVVYFVLIILIFIKSNIRIGNFDNRIKKFFLAFIFAPLTVMSISTTLTVVIKGNEFFDILKVREYSEVFQNQYIKTGVNLLPLWFILPGFVAILFSLEFHLGLPKISFRRKPKSPPVMDEMQPMHEGDEGG